MIERTYVFAMDAASSVDSLGTVQDHVAACTDFSSWWNRLPLVVMLEIRLSADAMAETLHELVLNLRFLLKGVNLAQSHGWLPEGSWQLIEKRARSSSPKRSARF